jgi:hypothetical protein
MKKLLMSLLLICIIFSITCGTPSLIGKTSYSDTIKQGTIVALKYNYNLKDLSWPTIYSTTIYFEDSTFIIVNGNWDFAIGRKYTIRYNGATLIEISVA